MREMTKTNRLLSLLSLIVALQCLPGGAGSALAQNDFLRGDVNVDGRISISDSLMIRRWLFNGDRPPPCPDSADFDDNGVLDLADTIQLISFAFLGGAAPKAPFPGRGTDLTDDGLGCDAYDITPPAETKDLIRIGDVQAAAGQEVRIPVFVDSSVEVEAFQLVVKYDPAVLEIAGRTQLEDALAGTFYEGKRLRTFFFAVVPHADEGIVVVGFIPSLTEIGLELPPREERPVLHIIGKISGDVTEPTSIPLEPTNGTGGSGFGVAGIRNELTHRGAARFISVLPKTKEGLLQIVGDQTFFIRGDADDDGKVDLSDARYTLNHLFLGEAAPVCPDAADADDNGKLDITDPIFTLQFLFLGGRSFPPPHRTPGPDPTPDSAECFRS